MNSSIPVNLRGKGEQEGEGHTPLPTSPHRGAKVLIFFFKGRVNWSMDFKAFLKRIVLSSDRGGA